MQVLLGLTVFAGSSNVHAHYEKFFDNGALPSCDSVADDPDGDGFGWVPHPSGAHSCVVDESSSPKPLFAEVGDELRTLNMVRTYWDPNVDFANKEIECRNYHTDFPEFVVNNLADDVFQITHYPLPDVSPWVGEMEINYSQRGNPAVATSYWRSALGGYSGNEYWYNPHTEFYIQMFAGYWGELIDIDGQQGMRFWSRHGSLPDRPGVINGNLYQECKYTSGQPFRPSGQVDQPATPSGITNFAIPLLTAGPPVEETPEIINLATNEMVSLQSFSWNIVDDLLFKKIHCIGKEWNGYYYDSYHSAADSFVFMPPLSGENTGRFYYNVAARSGEEKSKQTRIRF